MHCGPPGDAETRSQLGNRTLTGFPEGADRDPVNRKNTTYVCRGVHAASKAPQRFPFENYSRGQSSFEKRRYYPSRDQKTQQTLLPNRSLRFITLTWRFPAVCACVSHGPRGPWNRPTGARCYGIEKILPLSSTGGALCMQPLMIIPLPVAEAMASSAYICTAFPLCMVPAQL